MINVIIRNDNLTDGRETFKISSSGRTVMCDGLNFNTVRNDGFKRGESRGALPLFYHWPRTYVSFVKIISTAI